MILFLYLDNFSLKVKKLDYLKIVLYLYMGYFNKKISVFKNSIIPLSR